MLLVIPFPFKLNSLIISNAIDLVIGCCWEVVIFMTHLSQGAFNGIKKYQGNI